MKMRSTIIMLTIGFLLFGTISVYAQKGMGRMGDRKGRPGSGMCGERTALHELLELAPDQIKQLEDKRIAMKKQLIPLQADMKMARIELEELIRDDAARTVIDAKIDEIGGIRAEIQKIKVGHRLDFRSVLTDMQKQKLDSLPMGKQGCGHGCGHQNCCGGGQGFGMHGGDCPRIGGDGI